MEKDKEEKGKANVVAACEMVPCEGIYSQCDQSSMEGCDCGICRKVLFWMIVGVKIWAKGEVMQMEIEGMTKSGQG
jgi:hypothetical protein